MEERLALAVRRAPLHARLHRLRQMFNNWTPLIDQSMDLPRRSPSRATPTSTESASGSTTSRRTAATRCRLWANRFGFGEQDGHRHRPRDRRPRPDARVAAEEAFPASQGYGDRPHLEARLLDPARDRPGRPRGDAAADGALLRDDRERRQARHAAHRRGRRADRAERAAAAGAARASARSRRSRAASTRPRSRLVQEGLYEARTRRSARRTACSASSRSTSPARRARPRRSSRSPATRTASS